MRAFLAITVPDNVKEEIGQLQQQLRDAGVAARWVRKENFHLTLRFLDDVDAAQSNTVAGILREQFRGLPPLELHAARMGAFPDLTRRPMVLWTAVFPFDEAMTRLVEIADGAAVSAGVPRETKRFFPHITLGRTRSPRPSSILTRAAHEAMTFQSKSWQALSVTIFSSTLTASGSEYTPLEEFFFK